MYLKVQQYGFMTISALTGSCHNTSIIKMRFHFVRKIKFKLRHNSVVDHF